MHDLRDMRGSLGAKDDICLIRHKDLLPERLRAQHRRTCCEKGAIYSGPGKRCRNSWQKHNGMWVQVLQVGKGTRVASIMSLGEFSDDDFLVMLTKDGLIKRTPMKQFANVRGSLTAIKLRVCPLFEAILLGAEEILPKHLKPLATKARSACVGTVVYASRVPVPTYNSVQHTCPEELDC